MQCCLSTSDVDLNTAIKQQLGIYVSIRQRYSYLLLLPDSVSICLQCVWHLPYPFPLSSSRQKPRLLVPSRERDCHRDCCTKHRPLASFNSMRYKDPVLFAWTDGRHSSRDGPFLRHSRVRSAVVGLKGATRGLCTAAEGCRLFRADRMGTIQS